MTEILDIARERLQRISKDSEHIHEIISHGESFLLQLRKDDTRLSDRIEDADVFMSHAEHVLQVARDRLCEYLDEAKKLDEFIQYAEGLVRGAREERGDASVAVQPLRLPPRADAEHRRAWLKRSPAIDWITLLAWVALLGMALYYWASG